MSTKRMKSVDSSDRSLNVTFDGLKQIVRTGISRSEKELLHDISGDFRCGELTAIMGPSGAGKSTLIDILAGFMSQTSGTVSVGDSPRNLASFRRSSVYIMQDDYLEPLLTVEESMHIAADLKLRSDYYNKSQRIEQIVVAMGLDKCRHTRTSELSGGQRKRLAIALEIVNNPPVMFFDEPTSGLDSVTSKQCISLLRALAHEGPRTVIMTIHQPSATLLDMMDHLYVVAQGACIYAGGTKAVVPYLASHGLHCPTHYNPADFLMEICNGDYGDYNEKLIDSIENGRSNAWRSVSSDDIHSKLDNDLNLELPQIDEMSSLTDASAIYYATGFPKQLLVLLRRNFIRLSRDRVLTFTRLGMHCLIAIFLGFVFYDIGQDAEKARHNTGLLYLSLMFLMFSAFSATIITFPSVLPIMVREHFNRWYKLRSFYLANKLADLPIQITAVTLYILIVYFMTGQIVEGRRFFLLSGTCLVVSLVAQSIGVIVGIALNVQNGVVFGPFFIMPFVIFSGFFAHLNDAPWYLQWLFHISFLKYGFQSVMAAMYGFDRSNMNCADSYCHYKYPIKLLIDYDMKNVEYWLPMIFLFCLYITLDIVAFIILRLKLKKIV